MKRNYYCLDKIMGWIGGQVKKLSSARLQIGLLNIWLHKLLTCLDTKAIHLREMLLPPTERV